MTVDFPNELPPKDPAAVIPLVGKVNDPALVITGFTATATVHDGKDASPNNIIGATSYTASQLTVMVQNGIHGVTYKVKLLVSLQGGSVFDYSVLLPVLIS